VRPGNAHLNAIARSAKSYASARRGFGGLAIISAGRSAMTARGPRWGGFRWRWTNLRPHASLWQLRGTLH
jgi:hypothetical protein